MDKEEGLIWQRKSKTKRTSGSLCMVMNCGSIHSDASLHIMPGPMPSRGQSFSEVQLGWIHFIQQHRKFDPQKCKRVHVCSFHFDASQYIQTEIMQYKMGFRKSPPNLLPNAVPYIYKPEVDACGPKSSSMGSTSGGQNQVSSSDCKMKSTKEKKTNEQSQRSTLPQIGKKRKEDSIWKKKPKLENSGQLHLEDSSQSGTSSQSRLTNCDEEGSMSRHTMEDLSDSESWNVLTSSSDSDVETEKENKISSGSTDTSSSQDGNSSSSSSESSDVEPSPSSPSSPKPSTNEVLVKQLLPPVSKVSRRCGSCAPCLRIDDCGKCDFCLDLKKFGGQGRLRQKCRYKQCLLKAEKSLTLQAPNIIKQLKREKAQRSKKNIYPASSSESEVEEEIGEGIKQMKKNIRLQQKQKKKQKLQVMDGFSITQAFTIDEESWIIPSGSEDDDRSSLFLSSSSSSSSSPSPVRSPVPSMMPQTDPVSPSGFTDLPEGSAKLDSLDNMMDRMSDKMQEADQRADDNDDSLPFCLCRSSDYSQFIITCDYCAKMYHGKCVGVEELTSKFILKYACPPCRDKDPGLSVVYAESQMDPSTEPMLESAHEDSQEATETLPDPTLMTDSEGTDEATETPVFLKLSAKTEANQKKKKNKRNGNKKQEAKKKIELWRINKKKRTVKMCKRCGPCLIKDDCGECRFCKDKSKFGGRNIKRQKCLKRRCLGYTTIMPQSKFKYHSIMYDTSRITSPQLRNKVTYELKYHHDYAGSPIMKDEMKRDGQGLSNEINKDAKKGHQLKTKSGEHSNLVKRNHVKEKKKKKKEKKKEKKEKRKRLYLRCNTCIPCKRTEDCRICVNCKDKKKYGGEGRLHQKCILRICEIMKGMKFGTQMIETPETSTPPKSEKTADSKVNTKPSTSPKSIKKSADTKVNTKPSTSPSLVKKSADSEMNPKPWTILNSAKVNPDGCGACVACRTIRDCGYCMVCQEKHTNPFYNVTQRCLFKQCLVKTNKCGTCLGCRTTVDCGECISCRDNEGDPDWEKRECRMRRCLSLMSTKHPADKLEEEEKATDHQSASSDPEDNSTNAEDSADDYELMSSTNDVLKALPEQIWRWKEDPYFMSKKRIDWKKLEKDLDDIKYNLSLIDIKMIRLRDIITMPKRVAKSPRASSRASSPRASPKSFSPEKHAERKLKTNEEHGVSDRKKRVTRKCGKCVPCQRTFNCRKCQYCQDMLKYGGEGKRRQKCLQRRCKKYQQAERKLNTNEVHGISNRKKRETRKCGMCVPCQRTFNCRKCQFCLDMLKYGGEGKMRKKCLQRQCQNYVRPTTLTQPVRTPLSYPQPKVTAEPREKRIGRPNRRQCGKCPPCQRTLNCRMCIFCKDMLKHGGKGTLKEKCIMRQCKFYVGGVKTKPINKISSPTKEAADSSEKKSATAVNETPAVKNKGPPIIRESRLCDYIEAQQAESLAKVRMMCLESNIDQNWSRRKICGCPEGKNILKSKGLYCGVPKVDCKKHYNWEKLKKAELELERLTWLVKLDELLEVEKNTYTATTNHDGMEATTSGVLVDLSLEGI